MKNTMDFICEIDADGQRSTPLSGWKFDPVFPYMARAFGLNPAPRLNVDSRGNVMFDESIPNKVSMDGINYRKNIGVDFSLKNQNLYQISLMDGQSYFYMKTEPPATVMATARLISDLIEIKGVPSDLLNRPIISAKWHDGNEPDFIITAEAMEFECISQ